MVAMVSGEGEVVPFHKPVQARGGVEQWMHQLVTGMQDTMRALARQAMRDVFEQELGTYLFSRPAQMALLGLQFQWTLDTHVRVCACVCVYWGVFVCLCVLGEGSVVGVALIDWLSSGLVG